jgi:hypothetical protein
LQIFAVNGDSITYLENSKEMVQLSLVDLNFSSFGSFFNVFGIAFFVEIAKLISQDYYLIIIFIFNIFIYIIFLNNLFKLIPVINLKKNLLLLTIHPFIIASLTAPNKELIGFFVFSGLISSLYLKNYFKYIFYAFIGLVFRDVYFMISIIVLFFYFFNINIKYSLFIFSLFLPYIYNSYSLNLSGDMGQKSAFILDYLNDLDGRIPGTYILTFLPRLFIQLFGPLLSFISKPSNYIIGFDIFQICMFTSSLFHLYIIIKLAINKFKTPNKLSLISKNVYLAYNIIACTIPYSVHRIIAVGIVPLFLWYFFSNKKLYSNENI